MPELTESGMIMLGEIITFGVGIGVCILVMLFLNRLFNKLYEKKPGIHLKFFKSLSNVIMVIVIIYYALSFLDVTKGISKVLLQSGTLIVAVATFAAQQALGNVVSGFSISISKPYTVDDKVKVTSGNAVLAEGVITDVTIRHTVIRTFDGNSAIVPNSVMDSSVIINTNFTENVGNYIEVEIGYNSDIDKAREILKRLCLEHPLTINTPDMNVLVNRFTANGLVLKTTVWAKELGDNFKACSDIRQSIIEEYAKNGITIPYNIVTVEHK